MKKLLFVIICLASLTTYAQNGVKDISVKELKVLLDKNPKVQLVDVRTDAEVAEGFIQQAKHIGVASTGFKSETSKLDKTKPVYLYCAAGVRSSKAAKMLAEAGFNEVYNVSGGIRAWLGEGFKVVKK